MGNTLRILFLRAGMSDSNIPPKARPPAFPAPSSSMAEPAPAPVLTRTLLCRLAADGVLSAAAWEESLAYLGLRPDARAWGDFWRHVLLLAGALFLASGVVFFIAANWADMHRLARLALVQAVVAATALAAVRLGPDSPGGRLCLLVCGLCVGPMLAVFGQTYQTGAELWELFRVWGIVLAALALVGRQAALWLAAWLVGSLAVMLYLGRNMSRPEEFFLLFGSLPEYMLAQALALVLWEGAARLTRRMPQHAWLQIRWLPRLFLFALTANLTWMLFALLAVGERPFARGAFVLRLSPEPVYWLLYVTCMAGIWLWHRRRRPDLFALACCAGSLAVLLMALLVRARLFFREPVFAFFAWGVIIVGLTWAVGKILLALQRAMEEEAAAAAAAEARLRERDSAPAPAARLSFFSAASGEKGWLDLKAHLRGLGLLPDGGGRPSAAVAPARTAVPWYVRVMLAFGGWAAAILLMVFLGLFVFVTLDIRRGYEIPILVESLILLAAAGLCLRGRSFFARRFGFAAALAGAGGTSVALCLLSESPQHWPLFAALPLILSIPFMRSSSYRFLAALFASALVPLWFATLAGDVDALWRGRRGGGHGGAGGIYSYLACSAVWWTALAAAVVRVWLREASWRAGGGKADRIALIPPVAMGAYTGMLVFLLVVLGARMDPETTRHIPLSPAPAGLGAGIGFFFLIRSLTRGEGSMFLRTAILSLAALALPLGWFLPGAAAALLGMGLARYLGATVMLGGTGFFLFCHMVYYYYDLRLPLLQKFLTLAGVGLVLLGAGLAAKKLTDRLASARPRPADGPAAEAPPGPDREARHA